MHAISNRRFDAIAGYIRSPRIVMLVQEAGWFATDGDRLLGLIIWDRFDHDYGWVVLGRDRCERFRAIDQAVSLLSFTAAHSALVVRF
ncbi:hypothetical protein [Silvimonas sp.]|uniref:hypothetical protein n=1 Tax=Silvimonas sp. TaxID=2650811 RepID=UPI0028447E18|nr:hypothetical protein [Silvimonas sp.]MDR3426078.1 hypothetical protein [Silvimonas sp.]